MAQAVILMRSDQVKPSAKRSPIRFMVQGAAQYLGLVARCEKAAERCKLQDGEALDGGVAGQSTADKSTAQWSRLPEVVQPNTERPNSVDFGITALEAMLPIGDKLTQCIAPKKNAPTLLPAHLDAWAHTSPKATPRP